MLGPMVASDRSPDVLGSPEVGQLRAWVSLRVEVSIVGGSEPGVTLWPVHAKVGSTLGPAQSSGLGCSTESALSEVGNAEAVLWWRYEGGPCELQ